MYLWCFCPPSGDGMNAYVAYKVSTRVCRAACANPWLFPSSCSCAVLMFCPCIFHQTSLPMFRSKAFSVRRRFSDFLGLYEKLSVKQSLHGCIIPPPPEKSVVGGCQAFPFTLCFCTFVVPFVTHYLVQQEWRKWKWEWTTHHQSSLWREEEQLWKGVDPFMFYTVTLLTWYLDVWGIFFFIFTHFIQAPLCFVQVSSESSVSPIFTAGSWCAWILGERRRE